MNCEEKKMKSMKNIVSGILLVAVIACSFVACGKGSSASAGKSVALSTTSMPKNLVAVKTANFKAERASICQSAVVYEDGKGKFGLISFDGMNDTGLKFSKLDAKNDFFQMTTKKLENTVAGVNIYGMMDGNAHTVIPAEYAAFNVLNEHYIVAYKAIETTTNTKKALVSYQKGSSSARMVTGSTTDGTMYAGKWVVYSVDRKAPVPGAEGTSYSDYFSPKGTALVYRIHSGDEVVCDQAGTRLKEGYSALSEGYIKQETTDAAAIFDLNNEKMFDYNPNDYSVYDYQNGYFIAQKYANNAASYFILDQNGQKISEDFDERIEVYNNFVWYKSSLYSFKGKKIGSISYESSPKADVMTNACYSLRRGDDAYTIVADDGSVLVEGDSTLLSFAPKQDDKYYCFKDKKFSIEGRSLNNFMVSTSDGDGRYDAVDLLSGETLIEGYANLSANTPKNGGCYILAKRTEGGYDIWHVQNSIDAVRNSMDTSVTSAEALKDLYQKREDVFSQFEANFKKEGISITIDRATGEIALDSSVLFGGDSSEITADGKKLLDKFMQVYVDVLSDSKYTGFIKKLMVEGHTAPVAGSSYDEGYPLSKERAEKVEAYCASSQNGAKVKELSKEIEAIGYSNSKPIFNRDGTANMEASRRVSFRFIIAD